MKTSERPRIRPSWKTSDKILVLAATAGLLLLLGAVPFLWQELPERIPVHFGFSGEPDGWGAKGTLLILPVVGLILYASLMLLAKVPHVYNYPVPITPENAEAQYRLGRKQILILAAFLPWLLSGLLFNMAAVALGRETGLSPVLLIALLVMPSCALVGYLILARQRL